MDCFEQAIYLDSYDGYYSDVIMADGTITEDEYDLLYVSCIGSLVSFLRISNMKKTRLCI